MRAGDVGCLVLDPECRDTDLLGEIGLRLERGRAEPSSVDPPDGLVEARHDLDVASVAQAARSRRVNI